MSIDFNKGEFCRRLTAQRKAKRLTQKDTASALGISDKTYSKWETGDSEPDLSQLCALAEILSVSPAYLLGGDFEGGEETFINSCYDNLDSSDCLSKAFELQFYTVRGLAKQAFKGNGNWSGVKPQIPPNRVNPHNTNCITSFAADDTYHMMYNGKDANIALSLMPADNRMSWLTDERGQLSDYLSLIGDGDFLCCLRYMLSADFSMKYSASYLADKTGIPAEKAEELLDRAVLMGICAVQEVNVGTRSVRLYVTQADHMLTAILTLAHLSLPDREKNGCCYWHSVARLTVEEKGE
ncbi:MAG: helix-turn-helix domain-containing protein [Clostridia bacterium]|nr:helix-turn-helix domain-containing protein [Clostridia bacterium]